MLPTRIFGRALSSALFALLISLFAVGTPALAATTNYTYTTATDASLTDMSAGTTTIVGANLDDTASAVTNIGFDFYFQGLRFTQFSANSNGLMRLGPVAVQGSTPYKPLAQAGLSLLTPYGADLRTHLTGRVHSRVTGAAPNRVLVVEFLNMQANFSATGGTADLTYQVRLYETTGVIEYVYGSMTMTAAGAADANSRDPHIGFSSNNTAGNVGSVTAAQSGTPAPTYDGSLAVPVANLYVAGSIPVLTSATDGTRRIFTFTSTAPNAPTALNFTGTTQTATTLNWTDNSLNEIGFAIYRSSDGGVNYNFVAITGVDLVTFADSGLSPGTTYFYQVRAVSSESALSSAATNSEMTGPPGSVSSTPAGGPWSVPATWIGGVVPTAGDNVTIAPGALVTIDIPTATALNVTVIGILDYHPVVPSTLTVMSNLAVAPPGLFTAGPGALLTHGLNIGGGPGSTAAGSLIVDGVLDLFTSAGVSTTFFGGANGVLAGGGPLADFFSIAVNKGTNASSILTVSRLITIAAPAAGANRLNVLSGTFQLDSPSVLTPWFGSQTIVAAPGRLLLNHPAAVTTVVGVGTTTGAGSPTFNGHLQVDHGTFGYGSGNNTLTIGATGRVSINNPDATVNMFGRVDFASGASFQQTAGNFNVDPQAANATAATVNTVRFNTNPITFTGGTLTIVDPISATGTGRSLSISTTGAGAAAMNFVGGTIRFGDGVSSTAGSVDGFDIDPFVGTGLAALGNVVVDNPVTNAATRFVRANVAVAPLQMFILGDLNVTATGGSRFNLNANLVAFGRNIINNGTIDGTVAGSRLYWFNNGLASNYSGAGVNVAPLASWDVDNLFGVTIDPAVAQISVLRTNLFRGTVTNSFKLSLGNGAATTGVVQIGVAASATPGGNFDVAPTFNLGTGGQIAIYAQESVPRTTGVEINPTRVLTGLTVANTNNLTIAGGDLTVNAAITLTSGRVITGANTLISAAAGTVARTTGFVDGNFRKTFPAASLRTFEVGSANGYSPVVMNATAGTFPADTTVTAVGTAAPGFTPAGESITRFWTITAPDVSNADLTFTYLDPADLPGTVVEANLRSYRRTGPTTFADLNGTLDTGLNTASSTGVTSFGDFTLGDPLVDLSITKSDGVASEVPGTSVTYTIVAGNAGPSPVTGATVADTFPLSLSGCSTTCVAAGVGATCAAGPTLGNINDTVDLPAGGTATYTSTCNIDPAATGNLSNTATITAPASATDTNPANDSATDTDTLTPQYDLTMAKTDGAASEVPGTSVTYTITATAASGPSVAPSALVTDTFPASLSGCTWTCAGTNASCAATGNGNISDTVSFTAIGGTAVYTATCNIDPAASGLLDNTATVAGAGDTDPGNNSSTDSDSLTPQYDVSIVKTDGVSGEVPGTPVTYTITTTAAGPSIAPASLVTDTFPASLSGCTWSCAGTGATCAATGSNNISDMVGFTAVGGSAVYTATCNISAGATGTLVNTATVAVGAGDTNAANNTSTDTDTLGPQADLSVTKTDGNTSVTPGQAVVYTITASNLGPGSTLATVADTLPSSLTACTWTCVGANGGACAASGSGSLLETVTLNRGVVQLEGDPNPTATFSVSCTVAASASGSIVNTVQVATQGSVADPVAGNNSATDTNSVARSADAGITKTDGQTSATPGTPVTYTLVASNLGPQSSGATVTDNFPASLTGCAWTCVATGSATCPASGSGNIAASVQLPVGDTATFTATCNIAPTASGTLDNTATIAVTDVGATDPQSANNSATDSDTLDGGSANLGVSVTDNREFVEVGEALTTIISVSNAGPSNSPTNTVSSTLPTELSGGAWSCVAFGGATCAAGSGSSLSDTPNMPVGSQVAYVWSTTVQPGSPDDTFAVAATVAVGGTASDPTPANNSGSDTPADVIVIFKDGFDGPVTGVLEGLTDANGFAQASLRLDAGLLDSLGVAPITIATGEKANGSRLFRIELARFDNDTVLRLVMRDGAGLERAGAWQVVNLERRQLDFAWQPAVASAATGYLRVGVSGVDTVLTQRSERDTLVRLRVPVNHGNPALRPAD